MILLVLGRVVRVDGVSHVGGDKERVGSALR
jgi:hypothetical protein